MVDGCSETSLTLWTTRVARGRSEIERNPQATRPKVGRATGQINPLNTMQTVPDLDEAHLALPVPHGTAYKPLNGG